MRRVRTPALLALSVPSNPTGRLRAAAFGPAHLNPSPQRGGDKGIRLRAATASVYRVELSSVLKAPTIETEIVTPALKVPVMDGAVPPVARDDTSSLVQAPVPPGAFGIVRVPAALFPVICVKLISQLSGIRRVRRWHRCRLLTRPPRVWVPACVGDSSGPQSVGLVQIIRFYLVGLHCGNGSLARETRRPVEITSECLPDSTNILEHSTNCLKGMAWRVAVSIPLEYPEGHNLGRNRLYLVALE